MFTPTTTAPHIADEVAIYGTVFDLDYITLTFGPVELELTRAQIAALLDVLEELEEVLEP
jgi:hypothetical protein